MPKLTKAVPKYRKHRASGQAVITIGGRDHYLGPYGTKASRIAYDRVITEWLANDRQPVVTPDEAPALTVTELLARYWRFAKRHYRKAGESTSSLYQVKVSLRPLRRLYGPTLAREFGPRSLKAVRQHMIDAGLSRGVINKRIGIIKQAFKWGVGEELMPPSVLHGLQAVVGLQKGRTDAPDHDPVEPVPDTIVDATLAHLGPVVADMVGFQRLTGCRPGRGLHRPPRRRGAIWRSLGVPSPEPQGRTSWSGARDPDRAQGAGDLDAVPTPASRFLLLFASRCRQKTPRGAPRQPDHAVIVRKPPRNEPETKPQPGAS